MKKFLVFNICLLWILGVSASYAASAPATGGTTPVPAAPTAPASASASDPATDPTPDPVGNKCDVDAGVAIYGETEIVSGNCVQVHCPQANLPNADKCWICCDNNTPTPGVEKCMTGFYKFNKLYTTPTDIYEKCVTEQYACENSRNGASWNTNVMPPRCDCKGKDKEWKFENTEKEWGCFESENYKACTTQGSNAKWYYDYGCVCNEPYNSYWDINTHSCKTLQGKAECEEGGRTFVKWNEWFGRCECIKDENNHDITKPEDYIINVWGDRCVKKPSVLQREEIAANTPVADRTLGSIKQTIQELEGISEQMGKSHWKNESGGFNTARLASDSVAGVVLGTVGGVITSNVIKKNQVKGGFEDINCTIGGQNVAGYSDQFKVGLQ